MRARNPRAKTPTALTAIALLSCCWSCANTPTMQPHRPLGAAPKSAARLLGQWFGPSTLARDTGRAAARARQMLGSEMNLGTMGARARQLVAAVPGRLVTARRDLGTLAGAEHRRLMTLRHSPAWAALDPVADVPDLRQAGERLPALLQLDRRALGESDDIRHRTDPDDDHPEAGWLDRILRRVLP
ncbi:MAG: hypothetical protein AB7O97_13255 [Planctomycetota bacterium]